MKTRLALAAILPMLLYAILGAAMLRKHGGDLSRFVVAGDTFTDPASVPPCMTVMLDSGGYDGQFYYRLAVAPFAFQKERVAGVRFDYPVYRQQRIGYPLLASILTMGDPCRAILALSIVNLIAIGAIGLFSGLIFVTQKVPPILGALVPLYPGLIFAFVRDTTEIVYVTLLLIGAWLILRDRPFKGALALAFAALTRETALLATVALLPASGEKVAEGRMRGRLLPSTTRRLVHSTTRLLIPFAAFFGWKLFLFRAWNLPVNFGSSGVFDAPFAGIASIVRRSWPAVEHWQRVQLIELAMLALFAVIWGVVALTRRAPLQPRLMSAAYFAFAIVLSSAIWLEDWAYLRALSDFGVLALVVALHAPPRARAIVAALVSCGWLALAWEVVAMR